MTIQLTEGKKFYVRNGKDQYTVTVRRISIPTYSHYKWAMETGPDWLYTEVWADDGEAHNDDRSFDIVGEIKITSAVDKLLSGGEVMYFPVVEGSTYRTGGAWRMHQAESKAAYIDFVRHLETNRDKLGIIRFDSRSSNKFAKRCFPEINTPPDYKPYNVSDGTVKMQASSIDGRSIDWFYCEFDASSEAFDKFIRVDIEFFEWYDLPLFAIMLK